MVSNYRFLTSVMYDVIWHRFPASVTELKGSYVVKLKQLVDWTVCFSCHLQMLALTVLAVS